jgi:hypothetical protein
MSARPAIIGSNLMLQVDLTPAFGGCEDREANLQRGKAPFSGMQWRPAQNRRVVKLVDDFSAWTFWWRELLDAARLVAIDDNGVRQGAKIGALATHDH